MQGIGKMYPSIRVPILYQFSLGPQVCTDNQPYISLILVFGYFLPVSCTRTLHDFRVVIRFRKDAYG